MKKLTKIILSVFIILILLSSIAIASEMEITAKADKNTIHVGDIIEYSVIIKKDKNEKEDFFDPKKIDLKEFQILDYSRDEKDLKDQVIVEYKYKISLYKTGDFEIPSLELKYKDKEGKEKTITTGGPIKIKAESILPSDAKDIKDIKGPAQFKTPFPYKMLFMVMGLIVLFIILAFLFRWLYRKYFLRLSDKAEEKPLLPPEEEAYKALDELSSSGLLNEGKVKEFYIKLADILRRYLERRFIIMTFEKTTEEIMAQMTRKLEDRETTGNLNKLLDDFDLVKFAKLKPALSEGKGHILKSRSFVQVTAHREKEKEEISSSKEEKPEKNGEEK